MVFNQRLRLVLLAGAIEALAKLTTKDVEEALCSIASELRLIVVEEKGEASV